MNNQVSSPLATQIAAMLAANASLSAPELQVATGKSQPSISLAIAQLGDRVCKLGAARSTRYALTKNILGLPANQTLHFTNQYGVISVFGTLTQLHNRQIVVRARSKRQWVSAPDELPWFLKPLRPQGFLGRQYLQLRPDFPGDPETWTAEQALYIAVNHAADPPGAFGLGAIHGRLMPETPSEIGVRAVHYDQLAATIGKTLPAGSSAGGEQPKFLTELAEGSGSGSAYHHLIIKFSPPRESPFGKRWRALLQLEHLAQTILKVNGIEAAQTRIVESPVRTYLESQRFDRIGMDGKRHVVAIDALHSEFVDAPRRNWIQTAEALAGKKLITPAELSTVARIYAFGQFIGNSDMHFGNLSFFVDDVVKPTLTLAPVYDMLPMMWRPSINTGELDVSPVPVPAAIPSYAREQAEAREWAIAFWRQAAALDALGEPLRGACDANASRLGAMVL